MRYKVLTALTFEGLEKKVNKAIANGFRPIGGITASADGSYLTVAQAMIKED